VLPFWHHCVNCFYKVQYQTKFILTRRPASILGFYTLAACEILVEKLPRKYSKKYPPKAPAAKLARLAVAKNNQRRGYGALMMANAIERVLMISKNLGIIGFFVDAKNESAKQYFD
jgi:GNAT superfamily N-acetyltransferase